MMWNWMASSLFAGAAIVCFDGFAAYPKLSAPWDLVERERVTHLGTSPRFLQAGRKRVKPIEDNDLSALRVIFSTGSPLMRTQTPTQTPTPTLTPNAARPPLHRLAPDAGGLRVRLLARQAGCAARVHLGRHGHLLLFRAWQPAAPGAARGASLAPHGATPD